MNRIENFKQLNNYQIFRNIVISKKDLGERVNKRRWVCFLSMKQETLLFALIACFPITHISVFAAIPFYLYTSIINKYINDRNLIWSYHKQNIYEDVKRSKYELNYLIITLGQSQDSYLEIILLLLLKKHT